MPLLNPPDQRSDHEPRAFVDDRVHSHAGKQHRVMQHRVVRQRLDPCNAHERGEVQVDGEDLVTMALQAGLERA
ncbi:hypothetical protein QMK61_03425 [Fulvimonas sp. R45]|uniref:hypothetical protein n=1 Tax=Fulvimonas sp. R45 TaxID=3045937 RepID=UPI00265F1D68|nr:hypothetical protein [Fulvimonas sp. R45]MDO1527873.1 hypothetical protein [Fulvimonas sp. R45]